MPRLFSSKHIALNCIISISLCIIYITFWHFTLNNSHVHTFVDHTYTSNETRHDHQSAELQHYISSLKESLKPENLQITVVITSCGRLDLLNETITSFQATTHQKSYRINSTILVDDCCKKKVEKCVKLLEKYNDKFNIIFTAQNTKFGREKNIMNALQFGHSMVQTQWIYHIEDDWKFYLPQNQTHHDDVIETSLKVFESHLYNLQSENFTNPNNEWYNEKMKKENLSYRTNNVWMYSCVGCTNLHVVKGRDKPLVSAIYDDSEWYEILPNWVGFTFNAALYPSFVYREYIESFMKYKSEMRVSGYLRNIGFRYAAISPQQCYHIGKGRHIK